MREPKSERARNLERRPYNRLYTWPKWNRLVTARDVYQVLRRLPEFQGWTKAQHIDEALTFRYVHIVQSGEWLKLVRKAEADYGNHGSLIAGGLREHWPTSTKDRIRFHAHASDWAADVSMAHWQAGGRRSHTWRIGCFRPEWGIDKRSL